MQRRDFLKKGATGTMAFALSGLVLAPTSAQAADTVVYNLTATGGMKALIDGASIFTWSFEDSAGQSGPGSISSGMVVSEGSTIEVNLTNNLDRAINFTIPGVMGSTPSIAPGSSYTYTFAAPAAGSYMYTDDVNGFIGKAMGLAGPLVVTPVNGTATLYTGGPSFAKQYTLFMSDMDDRLNAAVQAGGTYNINDYEPNYYFANGLSYPDTKDYADTSVTMTVGTDVALRLICAGVIEYPMHFHGYHVNVISRNRVLETEVIDKDTPLVRPNEAVDVILPVLQAGAYPLHTHYVPGVTANGVYPNPYGGSLIIMSASN